MKSHTLICSIKSYFITMLVLCVSMLIMSSPGAYAMDVCGDGVVNNIQEDPNGNLCRYYSTRNFDIDIPQYQSCTKNVDTIVLENGDQLVLSGSEGMSNDTSGFTNYPLQELQSLLNSFGYTYEYYVESTPGESGSTEILEEYMQGIGVDTVNYSYSCGTGQFSCTEGSGCGEVMDTGDLSINIQKQCGYSGEECDDGNIDIGDGCDDVCQIEDCGNGVVDIQEDPTGNMCRSYLVESPDEVLSAYVSCDKKIEVIELDDGTEIVLSSSQGNLPGNSFSTIIPSDYETIADTLNEFGYSYEYSSYVQTGFAGTTYEIEDFVSGTLVNSLEYSYSCETGGFSCTGFFCGPEIITGDRSLNINKECGYSGEECDDGNTTAGDGCSDICVAEICGDNKLDAGEVCDDGNTINEDGCSSVCLSEQCGDGVIQSNLGELCDDGNTSNEDGCSAMCLQEVCGDGIVQAALGEICDDNNTIDGDGCSAKCGIEAGYSCPATGGTCIDIDECATNTHTCDTNSICTNTVGSFICVCDAGFLGDGSTCMICDSSDATVDCDGDSVPDQEEQGSKLGTDINGDGILDSDQNNIITAINSNVGSHTTTIINGCDGQNSVSFYLEEDFPNPDAEYNYEIGFHGFKSVCSGLGETLDVTYYRDKIYDTSLWTYRKYIYARNEYITVDDYIQYGTETVNGVTVTTVSISITDGGMLDADGLVNGEILDPIGPALLAEPSKTGGSIDTNQETIFLPRSTQTSPAKTPKAEDIDIMETKIHEVKEKIITQEEEPSSENAGGNRVLKAPMFLPLVLPQTGASL